MRVISSESIISGNADAAQFYSPLVPFLFLSHSSPLPLSSHFPPSYLSLPLHLKISLQWAWCLSLVLALVYRLFLLRTTASHPSLTVSSLVSGIQSLSVPFSTLFPDYMTVFTN